MKGGVAGVERSKPPVLSWQLDLYYNHFAKLKDLSAGLWFIGLGHSLARKKLSIQLTIKHDESFRQGTSRTDRAREYRPVFTSNALREIVGTLAGILKAGVMQFLHGNCLHRAHFRITPTRIRPQAMYA
uniref:Uncharacterized protein n=1 Tax=Candidatus Kentrum sp. FW TaxID=2126338 RepID=A0A450U459_9GAMM|nr:MAG: hypothetical protein BECKFW1821C_GA0114237_11594 [Candidatus Kentron sp. FW]